jgi:hypothetical protein
VKKTVLIALLLMCCRPALSQQPGPNLDSLKFLLGKWTGEGQSEVGAGSGYFTFEASLKDKVLIRKNHAEYPATKDRPAVIHEDLMIVYVDGATKKLRAFYTDSEGNTINYVITVLDDQRTITFASDPRDPGPRYRLTYVLIQPDQITLTFEVASPDTPDQFKKFLDGRVRKVRT